MNLNDLQQDEPENKDSLYQMRCLAEAMIVYQLRIKELEDEVVDHKKKLKALEEVELPDLMLGVGMKSFELRTGEGVTIKEIVAASINKANEAKAFGWLKGHGHGDLIKNVIKLNFGKGQEKQADHIIRELLEKGYDPRQTKSVHTQTLSAFVREQLAAGVEIPEELLGVYVGRKAIIK